MDWQLKRKNKYGWVFCGPAGSNNNKKLVHFAHSFMIAELLGFAEFLIKSMFQISGRMFDSVKVIAMDGKFDHGTFREALPGALLMEHINEYKQ